MREPYRVTERSNPLTAKLKVIIALRHLAAWKATSKIQLCIDGVVRSSKVALVVWEYFQVMKTVSLH